MELDINLDLPKNEAKKDKVKIDIGKIVLSAPEAPQPQKRAEIHDAELDVFDMVFEIEEDEKEERSESRRSHSHSEKKKKKFWPFSR